MEYAYINLHLLAFLSFSFPHKIPLSPLRGLKANGSAPYVFLSLRGSKLENAHDTYP